MGPMRSRKTADTNPSRTRPRFEEMSSFDLAEEDREMEESSAEVAAKKRGRRPRGRRRGGAEQAESDEEKLHSSFACRGDRWPRTVSEAET